ncbi:hypothetical protein BN1708_019251, partial [Verticillium longisporum]
RLPQQGRRPRAPHRPLPRGELPLRARSSRALCVLHAADAGRVSRVGLPAVEARVARTGPRVLRRRARVADQRLLARHIVGHLRLLPPAEACLLHRQARDGAAVDRHYASRAQAPQGQVHAGQH